MKIAYITSLYPAVSHTFILNEILALRRLGVEIGTFSINRAELKDTLGSIAESERLTTRSLLPLPVADLSRAMLWGLSHRPGMTARMLLQNVAKGGGLKSKLKWLAYTLEGILLAHWLVLGHFDHLHCHFGNSGSNTAQIAARLAAIPFSITCHGSELNDPYGFRLPEKVREAAFTVCVSKFGRARLMHVCSRQDWPKLHVVRCGQARSEPDDFSSASVGAPEILCVGRLSAEKGHYVLLDAFEQLQNRNIEASLTIVGDGPMRDELESRSRQLPFPGSIRFTGSLEPSKVAEYFSRSFFVVLASFSEGVPVVLIEAFAHGRPVVATRVGGVPELVEDGASGYVVSPGDATELADAMAKMLSDPARAGRMGKIGAKRVQEAFSDLTSAQQLRDLFQQAHPKETVL